MITKLNKVHIKDIWKTEDRDFTPWLVENIKLLNEDKRYVRPGQTMLYLPIQPSR